MLRKTAAGGSLMGDNVRELRGDSSPQLPRVTHLITGLVLGGAENAAVRLAGNLQKRGSSNQIVCLLPFPTYPRELTVPAFTLGVRRARDLPLAIRRMSEIISDHRSTVLCTWLYHADLFSGAMRLIHRKRLIMTWNLRTSEPKSQRLGTSRFIRPMCAKLSRWVPDSIVGNSEAVVRTHVRFGYDKSKMHCVPNGYDLDRFCHDPRKRKIARESLGIRSNEKLVGMVARWHPAKDHATFLEAVAQARKFHPDTRVFLAGAGVTTENEELQQLIKQNGLASHVLQLGVRSDVEFLLNAADVTCLFSNAEEGFPNAVAESMACERCCIASDTGGTAEVLGDCGVLVPRNNATAAGAALTGLLDLSREEREKMGRRSRLRVVERFSLDTMTDRYLALWS